ncbi:hypothetical protein QL093DRAFT_2503059 [Fusarium oxysporum]|nr:hypothetical protein QL093DRAFT_2503059 [Fusarium oxysporum]
MTPPRVCNVERVFQPCRAIKIIPSTRGFYSISPTRMSNSPLSPSPAGFSPTTLTPCPTPPSSVFSRLSQPKTVAKQLEEAAVGALPPNPTIENSAEYESPCAGFLRCCQVTKEAQSLVILFWGATVDKSV